MLVKLTPDWAKFCCLATFCLSMVCCTYFNNEKELGVDVLDFQFELGYFGYSFGYISKYWANFLVTLQKTMESVGLPRQLLQLTIVQGSERVGPWSQCYKTFHGFKFRIFLIS